jgi:hypothetical protein
MYTIFNNGSNFNVMPLISHCLLVCLRLQYFTHFLCAYLLLGCVLCIQFFILKNARNSILFSIKINFILSKHRNICARVSDYLFSFHSGPSVKIASVFDSGLQYINSTPPLFTIDIKGFTIHALYTSAAK